MKIEIERGHRDGPVVCSEDCMRRGCASCRATAQDLFSARMMGTCVRKKIPSDSTEKALAMSYASTHTGLVSKDASVQMVSCNEPLVPFPGENISTWKRWAQVDNVFQDLFKSCTALQQLRKWISGYRTLLLWQTWQRMRHFRPWWATKSGLFFSLYHPESQPKPHLKL